MSIKGIWILIFTSLMGYHSFAQDPLFSSTLDNPLYYNPATPGIIRGHEYRLNYREQWPGIPATLRAFNFTSTHQLRNAVGLGFMVMSNVEGESRLRTDKVEATIAFPIKISRYLKKNPLYCQRKTIYLEHFSYISLYINVLMPSSHYKF